ncbi:FecR domain-containing protein [Marinobacter sediminum]|uniref:FecR family protein n=1 Tax=Marinobacter sediminum TaxID=256323 RepID=UPI003569FA4A
MSKAGTLRTLLALATSAILWTATTAQAELSITQGSGLPSAQAPSAAAQEWLYTLRPGENYHQVAKELLARGYSASRLLQFNNIEEDALVAEGDSIRIPLHWLKRQPDAARVTTVSGPVQLISGATGRKIPLTPNTLIRSGDEIVSSSGSATVSLADGSEVRLAPDSRLIFNRLTQYGKSGMVDTRLRLNKGEVHTRVRPVIEGGARFEIETPSAVAAVRGTAFALQTSATGSSLQVTEGVVDFGAPGKTRRIPAGYSATVSSQPSGGLTIRRLPPAPDVNPLPATLTQLPATLKWAPSPATQHRLDIFESKSGRWVESRELDGSQFDISMLDNGAYEIHLAALTNRGTSGLPAVVPVKVDLQAKAASLIAPDESSLADDDMPEFSWRLNGQNEVARVEVAEDDSFNDLVTSSEWAPETSALPLRPLSPGQYYWRVVTEAGGTSVATSETRKVVVNGSLPPVRIISINYVDSQVRVFWEKVRTAQEYHLQLSEEPEFQNIIKEATLPETTAALRLIPGRRYFVRLKALSDAPLTSRWGPGRELYLE